MTIFYFFGYSLFPQLEQNLLSVSTSQPHSGQYLLLDSSILLSCFILVDSPPINSDFFKSNSSFVNNPFSYNSAYLTNSFAAEVEETLSCTTLVGGYVFFQDMIQKHYSLNQNLLV